MCVSLGYKGASSLAFRSWEQLFSLSLDPDCMDPNRGVCLSQLTAWMYEPRYVAVLMVVSFTLLILNAGLEKEVVVQRIRGFAGSISWMVSKDYKFI